MKDHFSKNHSVCSMYVVRHGKTAWNRAGRIQGHTDIPLLPEGEEQARLLADKLRHVKFDAAYSSDLIRAKQTASIIASEKLDVLTTPKLRERFWGAWEGQSASELRERHGPLFHQFLEMREEHEIVQHPDVPVIETYAQTARRVLPMLLETASAHKGKTLLIVSHYGVLKSILLHLKLGEFQNPIIENTGYIQIEIDGDMIAFKGAHGIRNEK